MARKTGRKKRDSVTGNKAVGERLKGRRNSGGEGPLRVTLHHVDSPEADSRLERAFQLILRAAQVDETAAQTQITDQ